MKRPIKAILLHSRMIRFLGRFRNPRVVILRYHSVREDPAEIDRVIGQGLVHRADLFADHMKLLRNHFEPVTMEDVLEFATMGRQLPRKAVAVTFDDGFADNAEVAAPIMEEHDIRGCFYIATGSIAPQPPPWFYLLRRSFNLATAGIWHNPLNSAQHDLADPRQRRRAFLEASAHCAGLDGPARHRWLQELESSLAAPPLAEDCRLMMDAAQIRRLHSRGHIIGSHTITHPNVAQIDEQHARAELVDSKAALEEIIGGPVKHFSYPSPILQPHYSAATTRIARECGYATAVTCTEGSVLSSDDPLKCRRMTVPFDQAGFRWRLELLQAGAVRNHSVEIGSSSPALEIDA